MAVVLMTLLQLRGVRRRLELRLEGYCFTPELKLTTAMDPADSKLRISAYLDRVDRNIELFQRLHMMLAEVRTVITGAEMGVGITEMIHRAEALDLISENLQGLSETIVQRTVLDVQRTLDAHRERSETPASDVCITALGPGSIDHLREESRDLWTKASLLAEEAVARAADTTVSITDDLAARLLRDGITVGPT